MGVKITDIACCLLLKEKLKIFIDRGSEFAMLSRHILKLHLEISKVYYMQFSFWCIPFCKLWQIIIFFYISRWFNFEKIIEALVAENVYHTNTVHLQTYAKDVCFIEDDEQFYTMLNFYHDLGMIVKHRSTVILKAQWLISLFKNLITIPAFKKAVEKKIYYASRWLQMAGLATVLPLALYGKNVNLIVCFFCSFFHVASTFHDILSILYNFHVSSPLPHFNIAWYQQNGP